MCSREGMAFGDRFLLRLHHHPFEVGFWRNNIRFFNERMRRKKERMRMKKRKTTVAEKCSVHSPVLSSDFTLFSHVLLHRGGIWVICFTSCQELKKSRRLLKAICFFNRFPHGWEQNSSSGWMWASSCTRSHPDDNQDEWDIVANIAPSSKARSPERSVLAPSSDARCS